MNLYELTEDAVKQLSSNEIYKRGLDYYRSGQVFNFRLKRTFDFGYDCYIYDISASVKSKNSPKVYYVHIKLNERIGIREIYCSCEAFERYYGVCKHTVAVLLKYINEKDKYNHDIYEKDLDNLMSNITYNMTDKDELKRELKVEYKLDVETYSNKKFAVELKVGETKTYVVKSISEFFDAMNGRTKSLVFGKNFEYVPANYTFSGKDKKAVEILQESYESQKMMSSSFVIYGSSSRIVSGKKVYITELQLKRFLDVLKLSNIDININNENYISVPIIEGDVPLEFDMKFENDKIAFKHKSDVPVPITEDGEYFFLNGKIYKGNKKFIKAYGPIYNCFVNNRSDTVYFNKDDCGKIASYILPSLNKIALGVNVDREIESKLVKEPLVIKSYIDKRGSSVVLKPEFCYGGDIINPLSKNGADNKYTTVVRNIESETLYLAEIKKLGFDGEGDIYALKNEEKIMGFLMNGIDDIQKYGEVYYSDSFKNMKVFNSSSYSTSVSLSSNDFLEFSFNIDGIDSNEIKNIVKALKEKKKYYRLKKGSFINLEDDNIKEIGNMLDYMDIKDSNIDKGKIYFSKYYAMYVDNALNELKDGTVNREQSFKNIVDNIKNIDEKSFKIPEHLDGIMRKYQVAGFNWFKMLSACGFGGILADEMGLGKTLQTIAFLSSERDGKKPSIVIVPTSLVYNWENEIKHFCPEIKTLLICGSKKERMNAIGQIKDYDVVVTSYPLLRRDIEEIKKIDFKYCFLDEGQNIKNPASINAKSVKELKSSSRFVLTGTPMENSLTELWSIFDFIMPGYLLSHNKFTDKYEKPIVKDNSKEALSELNRHIKPFILRRLKSEVVKELPPKIEHSILVDMTEEQKKIYLSYLAISRNEFDEEVKTKGFNSSKIKILALLTRLRQICCEPSIFIENFKGESGKMIALDELIEEIIEQDHRILLFSQFTSVLKVIEKRLTKQKIPYFYLDGHTPMKDRGDMVNEFNGGERKVFLISLKAGGTGLNLTGADTVIHFDPWWNPAVEDQATDRAHRIGQDKPVEVIKLISKGTIEEKIYNLQEKKKKMINDVLGFESDKSDVLVNMSEKDIKELFEV